MKAATRLGIAQRDFECVLEVQQTKQLPHVAKVDLCWLFKVPRTREVRAGYPIPPPYHNTQCGTSVVVHNAASSLHGVSRLESDQRGVADRCVTRL
ncbi:hypothetical protein TNCV_3449571 [Trichonephila clavipes]|nr:hypothetical protein TNCV_3449571 [Trichonephila clavipes]